MSPYIKLAILYYFTEEPLALSVGTIHGGPCSGSARPKTLLSGWSRPSLVSRPRRLLLASLTGSEGRGKLHPERPASCRRSVVSGDRRLLLASLTGSEGRGKLHPERPASCRRSVVSGDRRLLLASLTGSEGRGKLHPERPASCRRSVVSGDRRLLLASLTGSEGRGKLHPERPASCRRSVVSGDRRLLLASLTGSEGRGQLHPSSTQEECHGLGRPSSPLRGGPLQPDRRPRDVNRGPGPRRQITERREGRNVQSIKDGQLQLC